MRVALLWFFPAAAFVCAALAGQRAERGDPWFWVWVAAGAGAILGEALVAGFTTQSLRRARTDTKVVLSDSLVTMGRKISRLTAINSLPDRRDAFPAIVEAAASCAVAVVPGVKRVRATVYRQQTYEGVEAFVPCRTDGRGDEPISVFRRGTVEGDAVWDTAQRDKVRIVHNTRRARLPGFDNKRERVYRSFITAPVRCGDELCGLLTINAPKRRAFTKEDGEVLRVLGLMLGAALGSIGREWPATTEYHGTGSGGGKHG